MRTEFVYFSGNEFEHLVEQLALVHFALASEIDQFAVKSVAAGAPAIFVDQAARILSESNILLTQLVQFDNDRLHHCRQRDRVFHPRLRVADAKLDRVEKRMQSDVPPDLFRVIDATGRDEQ